MSAVGNAVAEPNSLVRFFRSHNPDDQRSDDEILKAYVREYGLEVLRRFPDAMRDYDAARNRELKEVIRKLGTGELAPPPLNVMKNIDAHSNQARRRQEILRQRYARN
ncbi:MAG TPA: hypothetical protein VF773_02195 [Verrucomicrobiae bacterium]